MTLRRARSIEIPGVHHGGAPIPMGARVGNTLYSSGIPGINPESGELPVHPAEQAKFAFMNMRSLLNAGGATLDDVVRVTVYLKDPSVREHVNGQWLMCFPDANDRPARHTLNYDLQHGMLLQIEVVAVIESK